MVLEVVCQVVEEEPLLLPLLDVLHHPDVQVHHQGVDLARLPVFPQPPRNVEQQRLQREKREEDTR